jgi:Zn-dependent metalloprotease
MILLNAISPIMKQNGERESGHNANWNGSFQYDGKVYGMMKYYDGVARDKDTKELFGDVGLIAGIDVLGHEVTHGVTESTANLVYSGESGALNEGFSDIFGTNVKAAVEGLDNEKNPNWTWTMGDGWWPIRNMANPNEYGNPDTYLGQFWESDPLIDNGGVHINSGVLNYWYVLATEGSGNLGPGRETADLLIGSHESYTNDNGYAYAVKGIGMKKMQGVAYRALVKYLDSDSDFEDARKATIKAANDLTKAKVAKLYPGVPRLALSDVETVISAWNAVGVGGGFEPVSNSLPLV